MKLLLHVALACLIGLTSIHQVSGDNLSSGNWTCMCSSSYWGDQSFVKNNCSTSCDCNPADGQASGIWMCVCADNGFPKLAAASHDSSCFTSCNCTSGTLTTPQATRKHVSSKIIVLVLLLCVVLSTLAVVALITCYIYQKDKHRLKSPLFFSEREGSFNSATNLLTRKASPVSETQPSLDSFHKLLSVCFCNGFVLCDNKSEIIHGTIARFSYIDLEYATAKFSDSNLIGLGGSSYVYRGQLRDGRVVAIKRLKILSGSDGETVFSTEVEMLARLHHCHVVPLIGYCSESQGKHSERLLVFEYMPNGSLRDCLDGTKGKHMNWETRVTIAIGAARGLEYLHEAAAPRVLHRDVKSTNVLLDENCRAKITDLGMAKHIRADGIPSSSNSPARMQGTFGYFAPEYAMVGKASVMSDVFSFGVVLLELITGRQPIHKSTKKGGDQSLVLWAAPRLQDGNKVMSELPDPRLKGKFPKEEMQIMAYLAKECLLMDPDARPTMSEIVQILSTISPDKSRRRNSPVNLLQMSSIISSKAESPRDVPPSNETNQAQNLLNGELAVSSKYMERLIHSSSNAQHDSEDEAVDLTEPRFESFHMNSVRLR